MGFHGSTSGPKTTWAKFAEGKIVLSSKDPREGYHARTNKMGNVVHEQHHDAFTGYLQDIQISESEYGKQFVFRFLDGVDYYNITAGYSSRYAKSLLNALCAPQCDLGEKLTLQPYSFKNEQDKTITGVTVHQRGDKIPVGYDKTVLPPLREVTIKGQTVYDDTEVMDFFVDKLNTVIRPKLTGAKIVDNVVDKFGAMPMPAPAAAEDDGGLPF